MRELEIFGRVFIRLRPKIYKIKNKKIHKALQRAWMVFLQKIAAHSQTAILAAGFLKKNIARILILPLQTT